MSAPLSSETATRKLADYGAIPIDRMAWRVVQPGEHYERPQDLRMLCFDDCPPTIWRGHNRRQKQDQLTNDYSGVRIGRLTVIGYWGRTKPGCGAGGQWWACRCLCGLHTVRNARAIANWLNGAPKSRALCDACFVDALVADGITKQSALAFVGRTRVANRGDVDKIFNFIKKTGETGRLVPK